MTLNEIIKYAKDNNIDFDAPLWALENEPDGYDSISTNINPLEQIGISKNEELVLISYATAYQRDFHNFGIRNVVNEVR